MQIDIVLKNSDDAFNPFNDAELSDSFNDFIMRHCDTLNFKNKNLVLNITGASNKIKKKLENTIHNYYSIKLTRYQKLDNIENYVRIGFFIIGILAILISEIFTSFLSELFLIAAWVIVWELVYDLLFNEIKRRRKAKIYKLLRDAEIVFRN